MQMSSSERIARERLALLKKQREQKVKQDITLGRFAKGLRREDFKQQTQPVYTQVAMKAGEGVQQSPVRAITNPPGSLISRNGPKGMGPQGPNNGANVPSPNAKFNPTSSGGMGITQQAQKWYTSGYQQTSQANSFSQALKRQKNKQLRILKGIGTQGPVSTLFSDYFKSIGIS